MSNPYSTIIKKPGGGPWKKEKFARRVSQLRQAKGVSARDMSLSLGQSAGYINNIENGVNLPSMSMFFYICDYLGVTPEEFFAAELTDPVRLRTLTGSLRRLRSCWPSWSRK